MQFSVAALFLLVPALSSALVVQRASQNLQTFTGALGGITAIPVTPSGDATRPFAVDGTTDVNIGAALQRSCSVQNNACANAANSGAAFSVGQCNAQQQQCNAAASGASASGAAAGASSASKSGTAAAAAPAGTGAACSA